MRFTRFRIVSTVVTIAFALLASNAHTADTTPAAAKARIVVMTDIGGDPDDRQSMVRFLLQSCEFDVEGLLTGFGHGHYKTTRPDLIREAVNAYGRVLPNLLQHRSDYPSLQRLRSLIKDGYNGDPHSVGSGKDSEASEWIIKVLERDDPRPVWFSIWGGPRELAQAIWKIQKTHPAGELAALKRKIRVHSIADQDRTAGWVKQHHPDVFWIFSRSLFRGIWKEGDQAIVSPAWLKKNVRTGHGPLGMIYPAKAAGKDGVKEGDTPSFFYALPQGLSDPEHPEWGNWGGRFHRSGRGNEFLPAEDLMDGTYDMLYTIHRWRSAYQNDFEARMDWCVKPYAHANHHPKAAVNGDRTMRIVMLKADPGSAVKFSAAGSSDPDGQPLRYRWWTYREAGTYWDDAPIQGGDTIQAVATVPDNASGRMIHVILEVTDTGTPPLTAYRRVIVTVSGKPAAPPAGARGVKPDLSTPVTRLTGPPPKTGPWRFWRGININGGATTIDGNAWEGDPTPNFVCNDKALVSSHIRLLPPTDPSREKMIHSFRWDRQAGATVTAVPKGTFAVYAYVWEETGPETIDIRLNKKTVERRYRTGRVGQWRRLGPWITDVAGGKIIITTSGGAANLSGIEIWKRVE